MGDIRQDRSLPSSPEGNEEPSLKKVKNSRKKRSWTWAFFEEVDITEQMIKESNLKGVKS